MPPVPSDLVEYVLKWLRGYADTRLRSDPPLPLPPLNFKLMCFAYFEVATRRSKHKEKL